MSEENKGFQPTIGLEIHAELKTQTKMFCDCLNDSAEQHANVNICPVCVGHPGTLPTINKKAIEYVLKVGLALGGKLFSWAKFDRKNYFYPDLPKGYQISQYDRPFIEGGALLGVRIKRIHLEEDTGRLIHSKDDSLVDFNRAGVPLMELVTEPDIKTAKQAADFAKELQLILRHLEVSDTDMEKGHLRLEANVSVSATGSLGTKVEIKNINSFKALEDAINYEINRQENLLKANKEIIQETRGWNESKQATISQRSKEEAHDYRYFSEPDLPPLDPAAFNLEILKAEIPELPEAKRKRFVGEFGLSADQAAIIAQERSLANFFEQAASELESKQQVALLYNYFTSDVWGLMKKEGIGVDSLKINPLHLAHLIDLISKKEITSRIAKDLLQKIFETGLDPHEIMEEEQWAQISSADVLQSAVESVIAENSKAVGDYKSGKPAALQFLVGMAMSKLGGKANPEALRGLLERALNKD